MMNKVLAASFLLLGISSCSSFSPEQLSGEWNVVKIGAEQVEPGEGMPYIGMDGAKVWGYTGCNRLMGTVSPQKGKVDFSQVATTMMLCPEAKYETSFLEALRQGQSVKAKGHGWQLLSSDGTALLEFERRSLTGDLLHGEWSVVELEGLTVEPSDDTPFLGFDVQEKRIYGFTGCNRLTGLLDVEAFLSGLPRFDQLGSTRMLCPEDTGERQFLSALFAVEKMQYVQGQIKLQDKAGKTLIVLQKRG